MLTTAPYGFLIGDGDAIYLTGVEIVKTLARIRPRRGRVQLPEAACSLGKVYGYVSKFCYAQEHFHDIADYFITSSKVMIYSLRCVYLGSETVVYNTPGPEL